MRNKTATWRLAGMGIGILGLAAVVGYFFSTHSPQRNLQRNSASSASYGTPTQASGSGDREPQSVDQDLHDRLFKFLEEQDPQAAKQNLWTLSHKQGDIYAMVGGQIAKTIDPESAQTLAQSILERYGDVAKTHMQSRPVADFDLSTAPKNLVNFPLQQMYGEGTDSAPIVDGWIILSAESDHGPVIEATSSVKRVRSLDPLKKVTVAEIQAKFLKESGDPGTQVDDPQLWIYVHRDGSAEWCWRVRVTTGGKVNVRSSYYWVSAREKNKMTILKSEDIH